VHPQPRCARDAAPLRGKKLRHASERVMVTVLAALISILARRFVFIAIRGHGSQLAIDCQQESQLGAENLEAGARVMQRERATLRHCR